MRTYAEVLTLVDEQRLEDAFRCLWRSDFAGDFALCGLMDWFVDRHWRHIDPTLHDVCAAMRLRKAGGREEQEEAEALLAAHPGMGCALAELGWLHKSRDEVERARECFSRAAEAQSASGLLGLVLTSEEDDARSYSQLQRLAQGSHVYAMYHLGVANAEGWWRRRVDNHSAALWLARAAETGLLPAAEAKLARLTEERDCAPWGRFKPRRLEFSLFPPATRARVRLFLLASGRAPLRLCLEVQLHVVLFITSPPRA